jgi:hypothetical protein
MKRAFVLLAFCVATPVLAADPSVLELPPAVQAEVVRILKDYKPARRLEAVAAVSEVDNPGNFGKMTYFESDAAYTLLESGLWGTEGTSKERQGRAAGQVVGLSLCGLVSLASAGGSASKSSTSVLIGKIPFGITNTTAFRIRTRVTALDVGGAAVCAPQPGDAFTIRMEWENDVKNDSMFVPDRVVTLSEAMECKARDGWKPAAEWSGLFPGDGLGVDCKFQRKDRDPGTRELVFMRDFASYFRVVEKEFQKSRITYSRIEYR